MHMKRKELEAAAARANPRDGFRVRDVVVGQEHSLHLTLYRQGQPVVLPISGENSVEVSAWDRPSDANYGSKARSKLLLEAMCRFLNTGGTEDDLALMTSYTLDAAHGANFQIDLPGYHLISSDVNSEGVYEHVFASDASPWALRWVEDEFFDVVSLADMAREAADEEAADDGPTGQESPLLQLPDRADFEPARDDEVDFDAGVAD